MLRKIESNAISPLLLQRLREDGRLVRQRFNMIQEFEPR